jgi:hypothetical protein
MVLANFLPVVIACCFWFAGDLNRAPLAGFVALFATSAIGGVITAYFLREKMQEVPGKWTWGSIWWELTFSNIFALKDRVQPTIQYIPDIWAYLIKGLIPHLLIIVFVNAAAADDGNGSFIFYHYGGYPERPYQVMGVVCFAFALVLFLVGFFYPQIYAPLATAYEVENQEEVKEIKESDNSEDELDKVPAVAEDKAEKVAEVEVDVDKEE